MTPECPLCGGTRDFLRLRLSSTERWWELHLADQPSTRIGSAGAPPRWQTQIEICENGHFWPRGVARVNVVRLLGTTAGGKTMLLRNLNHQVVPGLDYHEAPRLCARAFDRTRHPAATLRNTVRHYTILNDLLEQDYQANPGVLAEFLRRLNIDPEQWGTDQRSPYHLLTSDGTRKVLDTVFIDLPGEAMPAVYSNTADQDAFDLAMSDGLAWVVDMALFPGVQRELQKLGGGGEILLESLAPDRNKGRSLNDLLADQVKRYAETAQLAKLFSLHTERLAPEVFRATVLTKADLVLDVLKNAKADVSGAPSWDGLWGGGRNLETFRSRFLAGGVQFLQSCVKHQDAMPTDQATAAVLRHLGSARTDHAKQLLGAVTKSVLDFYAEPDRFAELVLDEEVGSSSGGPFLHEIKCAPTVRLQIAPMGASWTDDSGPQSVRHRDLAVGIIVRAILGADDSLRSWVAKAEERNVIHYFLTAPLVAGEQVTFANPNAALAETPGVQHLLAWSVR